MNMATEWFVLGWLNQVRVARAIKLILARILVFDDEKLICIKFNRVVSLSTRIGSVRRFSISVLFSPDETKATFTRFVHVSDGGLGWLSIMLLLVDTRRHAYTHLDIWASWAEVLATRQTRAAIVSWKYCLHTSASKQTWLACLRGAWKAHFGRLCGQFRL